MRVGRIPADRLGRHVERVALEVVVDASAAIRRVTAPRMSLRILRDRRIRRRRLAVRRRERQQVDRLRRPARRRVREDALLRVRVQHVPVARDVARLTELFVVDEEERLVAAVEQPGMTIGPPARTPNWFCFSVGLGDAVAVVEPGVRVQLVAAIVVIAAAREVVAARARHELDLHRALARARLPASPSSP